MSRTIHISNLPFGLTSFELQALCLNFGSIESHFLLRNPDTGMSKGQGSVTFLDPASAHLAGQYLHGLAIRGRYLKVHNNEKIQNKQDIRANNSINCVNDTDCPELMFGMLDSDWNSQHSKNRQDENSIDTNGIIAREKSIESICDELRNEMKNRFSNEATLFAYLLANPVVTKAIFKTMQL